MSPHAANSLVHDLVEMAKAMETLPQVQAELENAKLVNSMNLDTIQRLEQRLIDKATEIDTLHTKIAAAEVARDTAETMFLETDDKLVAFRHLVSAFSTDAASLLRAQEPQPEPEPMPDPVPAVGQSASSPIPSAMTTDAPADTTIPTVSPMDQAASTADSGVSVPSDPTPATESSSGSGSEGSTQHEDWARHNAELEEVRHIPMVDPTAPSPAGPTPSPASAPIDAAATVADAPASQDDNPGPYFGRKWSEVTPRVYNYNDWVRGGGTIEDFSL
jgi:hypothetical protein